MGVQQKVYGQLHIKAKQFFHPMRYGCPESVDELHQFSGKRPYAHQYTLHDGSSLSIFYWAESCFYCGSLKPNILHGKPNLYSAEIIQWLPIARNSSSRESTPHHTPSELEKKIIV